MRQEKRKPDRHVRLYHWILDTDAWKRIPVYAKVVYIGLRRYNGSNNGRIAYSVRDAAHEAGIALMTAARAFRALEANGFVVTMKKGAFSRKVRHASEFRLTEFACNASLLGATKEFARLIEPEPAEGTPIPERIRRTA